LNENDSLTVYNYNSSVFWGLIFIVIGVGGLIVIYKRITAANNKDD
jgi:hypothetical protein